MSNVAFACKVTEIPMDGFTAILVGPAEIGAQSFLHDASHRCRFSGGRYRGES